MVAIRRCLTIGVLGVAACGKVASETPDAAPTPDAPAGPTMITLANQQYTGLTLNTGLVAFQDGDGPWQAVTGNAGVYTFMVSQPRYSVATACERTTSSPLVYVTIGHFAVSDGTMRYTTEVCATATTSPMRVTISGTVTGLAMTDQATVSDGISSYGGQFTAWTMPAVAGAGTLLGVRQTNGRAVGLLFQKVSFAAGATFPLDFTQQFFPSESNVTFDPTATNPSMFTTYYDENGGSYSIDFASTVVPTYRALPADRVGDGLSSLQLNSNAASASRSVRRYFKTPTAQTLTLPGTYLPPAPQVDTTTPSPLPAQALTVQPGARWYEVGFYAQYKPTTVTTLRYYYMTYSAGWIGDATMVDARVPDLSALPGWGPDWGLPAAGTGVSRSWTASVNTGPAATVPGTTGYDTLGRLSIGLKDGDEVTSSSSSGSF